MGAGQSLPSSLPSRSKYKGQVIPAQDVVNTIFKWMMEQMDTNDLLKLANPKQCKEYVFLTREVLDRFMRQIQLEPKLGAKNTLYFQSVRQLTFADEQTQKALPSQKEYRDTLCAQLAFFTVRLFQVFGALALTVIDSLPDVSTSVENIREAAKRPVQQVQQPALFGPILGGGKVGPGNASNLDKFYTYARSFFYSVPSNTTVTYVILEQGKTIKTAVPGAPGLIFYLPYDKENYKLFYAPTRENIIRANLDIINDSEGVSYTLVIKDIIYKDEATNLTYTIPMTFKTTDYFYQSYNFYNVIKKILDSIVQESKRGKSFEEILGVKKEAARVVERVDEAGIPEGLSYLKIKDYLKTKPKAYCVARAIQLLSPTLPEGMSKGIFESDVCYFDSPEGYMKDSIPQYNHAITTNAPGIRALNQLFYDVLKNNIPAMDKQTQPKYQEFVRVMQSIFSPQEPQKTVERLDKIMSLPFKQCEDPSLKNKRIILTTKNSVRETQKVVAELLNYQMRHTAEVAKFMNKLFLLDKKGFILGIQPAVLKGGIPYINKVSEEARILLTEYYKFCESTYRIGALRVLGLNPTDRVVMDRIPLGKI